MKTQQCGLFQPLHTEKKQVLLVVEDSEQDYEMFLRSVKKLPIDFAIEHFETGDSALEYLAALPDHAALSKATPRPDLILLDLNLPGTDGREVLKRMRQNPVLRLIPIVIFSTSSNPKDIQQAYQNGANAYAVKPMDVRALQESVEILLKHWLLVNTLPTAF